MAGSAARGVPRVPEATRSPLPPRLGGGGRRIGRYASSVREHLLLAAGVDQVVVVATVLVRCHHQKPCHLVEVLLCGGGVADVRPFGASHEQGSAAFLERDVVQLRALVVDLATGAGGGRGEHVEQTLLFVD